ncbi:hypothetical protein HNR07_001570 [Nocardiopsis metallicus]|uniref:Uncharacterized protein n=1 Tax=Nocardiopsis metallicus TaxID=179819 RepID=A0A840W525_9ACTN|nr:hypothetical protein [Nocardiopsis metallicus]
MTGAFTGAVFRLCVISEPQPDAAARALFPEDFQGPSTRIGFLLCVFVLEVP